MRARVPADVLDAFEVLDSNRDFRKIISWLTQTLEETREANDLLEGISLTRSQGQAIVLAKIVTTAKAAKGRS